jgi:hypothetical protein
VYGPNPPAALKVTGEYEALAVPDGTEPGLTVTAVFAQATASPSVSEVAQPLESVAVIVMLNMPVCVGLPDSTPLVKVIPVGSVPDSLNVTVPIAPV